MIELVAGLVLLAVAVGLWADVEACAPELPMRGGGGGSAFIAGASIAAIVLPTAAPYFAVIDGISSSKTSIPQQIELLVIYTRLLRVPAAGDRCGPAVHRRARRSMAPTRRSVAAMALAC